MNLARMMTDKVYFEDMNGIRTGPYKTRFGTDRITVFQDELNVGEGDHVVQPLADGTERIYVADNVTYNAGRRNIPGHFSITITREAESPAAATSALHARMDTLVSNVQAGDNNNVNIAALIRSLAQSIENTDLPAEQKDEAKRLLRTLIEHPVMTALLGGAKAG
ncbi:MAG TPA: hypothetical protein VEC01_05160 [Noviherbaspirillum sp.]|uniref:hypothetical protein n=1 Tax=Noviherbaspirillum sp. TaxID=1926288 RepID=UPI002D446DD8|nr:hypothetical protein [Noviherbaspirillum sp.]HYD94694.1 hypothetical protein [Noviherbaspirillum sp.]